MEEKKWGLCFSIQNDFDDIFFPSTNVCRAKPAQQGGQGLAPTGWTGHFWASIPTHMGPQLPLQPSFWFSPSFLCGFPTTSAPEGQRRKEKHTPVPCWLRDGVRSVTLLRCFTICLQYCWNLTSYLSLFLFKFSVKELNQRNEIKHEGEKRSLLV